MSFEVPNRPLRAGCTVVEALAPVLLSTFVILTSILQPSMAHSVIGEDLSGLETRVLRLDHELKRETLPLMGRGRGRCVYELVDLKESHWYEVKISYPASIPARFSLELVRERAKDSFHHRRQLLNTEKVIFQVDEKTSWLVMSDNADRLVRVLLSVEPEGVVAQPRAQEQQFIIYNIVAEEVRLGVPMQAFWVGFVGLMAIGASIFAAQFLPSLLRAEEQRAPMKSNKQAL